MIPKVFFQTAIQPLQQYVLEINKQYLEDWEYKYFSDNDIIHFFQTNKLVEYPNIIAKFQDFKGCHKADLFRYYYLYVNGGVFMDSDAVLCKTINEIVNTRDFISVNSSVIPNSLFQGLIGCTPKHEIMKLALEEAYNTPSYKLKDYHYFCKSLFKIVQPFNVPLFKEVRTEECDEIHDDTIIARHYTREKIIPLVPSFLNQLYSWGYNYIVFLKDGKMNAFGRGEYKIIDKYVITATFGKKQHTILFNSDYTTFTSVRGDGEVMIGKREPPFLKKSLVASYSTPNYSKLTDIYRNSLEKIEANTEHWLEEVEFTEEGFQTDLWYHCVSSKMKNVINVLSKPSSYKYFIFSDCDVHFIHQNKEYWNVLEEFIVESPENIFFMRENNTHQINSGFFIIKNNDIENTIAFFNHIFTIMQSTHRNKMPFGDQTIINEHLHLIKYNYIPHEYVIWGKNVVDKNTALFHHAVQCDDIESKLEQIFFVLNLF
jgi:hypothetical protein